MIEIAVCDDDANDLDYAVNILHEIFTAQNIGYHIKTFLSANVSTIFLMAAVRTALAVMLSNIPLIPILFSPLTLQNFLSYVRSLRLADIQHAAVNHCNLFVCISFYEMRIDKIRFMYFQKSVGRKQFLRFV